MNASRRTILAACGAGLTALAGCSGLAGEDTPTYDGARLADLGQMDVPSPPATFPVTVPDAMVSRHREQARELVEQVPEQPTFPNAAVSKRLQENRTAVLDRLDATDDHADGRARTQLRRLRTARGILGEAAAVDAAYRAATDDITEQAVADRRNQLRSALLAFERDWTYRGDDAATAAVVYRVLEAIRLEARRGIAPERGFPADPSTDPFRVGEIVRHLAVGRAALADAKRLRGRYREALTNPRPYRTDISVVASRLRHVSEQYRNELDEYADPDFDDLPFERSIEGTPLERLYARAVDGVEIFRTDAEEARHRGDHATELVETGIYLTVLRALESVVADIRNDRVTVPETVDGIEATRQEAIDSLESAWASTPTVLAVEVARWAWLLVNDVPDRLSGPAYDEGETPDTRDGYQVWAIYVTAARVAAAVPQTVAEIRTGLDRSQRE